MATSTPTPKNSKNEHHKKDRNKRAPLPSNARIQKRPILHAPLPSPYTSAASAKTIYLSARTPFMSAIKRCEKLLQLSEKRLVQAATTAAKSSRRRNQDDSISEIAAAAERIKRRGRGEEVVFKASGKAIGKGLQVGCWFQERDGLYNVRLQTGTAGVVDGIEYDEGEGDEEKERGDGEKREGGDGEKREEVEAEDGPEARIRQISVLEVYVSLK
ncbi:uncharacterized protein RCC_00920 [Ramularia collo-cygni]|uniref:Uncharacterized protein n=1 Tax=Ramularia collo-cygni TaxID=112498 RepID=A0A2D3UVH5_9PEZI|nr:uncharacterized protein RCC_00920 [Ramularia collo-cygni]CZT15006.1 uncharacterized protein RCC_00920 [Ramularia collo-cygni]